MKLIKEAFTTGLPVMVLVLTVIVCCKFYETLVTYSFIKTSLLWISLIFAVRALANDAQDFLNNVCKIETAGWAKQSILFLIMGPLFTIGLITLFKEAVLKLN